MSASKRDHPRRAPWLPALELAATIRLGLAVVALLYAALTDHFLEVLPWVLLVVVLDLFIVSQGARWPQRGTVRGIRSLVLLTASAASAGVGYAVAGPAAAPVVLVPAYHGGQRFGRAGFLLSWVVAMGAFLIAQNLKGPVELDVAAVAAWLGSALALGLLGIWSQRLTTQEELANRPNQATDEAIELIGRLRVLADDLDTGFDAPASASSALDRLSASVATDRSAVLLSEGGAHLVPVALRGATRAPWAVVERIGAALDAVEPATSHVFFFTDDLGERTALVIPLLLQEGSTCLVVADRPADRPFGPEDQEAAVRVTRAMGPSLSSALLFGSLRARASLEERRRIARDIHDGLAQEIAALGYRIDALRARATAEGSPLLGGLDDLRRSLGETLVDVRLHITDLRMTQRPETGLGALIGAAVQRFGSLTGIRTTVTVSESLRRLDPRLELQVHRIVADVLTDAQAGQARTAGEPHHCQRVHTARPQTVRLMGSAVRRMRSGRVRVRVSTVGAAAALVLTPLALLRLRSTDDDLWLHLRVGALLRRGENFGLPDPLVEVADRAYVPTQWLAERAMSHMWDIGGLRAIHLVQLGLVGALVTALLATALLVAPGAPTRAFVVTLVAAFSTAAAWGERPQLLGLTFLALAGFLWTRTVSRGASPPWGLVGLTWLWATVHGTWFFGVLVGLLAVISVALDGAPARRVVSYAAVPLLSVGAACLTPLGTLAVSEPFAVGTAARAVSNEWQAPTAANPLVWALAGLAVYAGWHAWRARRWGDLLTILTALALAGSAVRLLAVAAVLLAPVAARGPERRLASAATHDPQTRWVALAAGVTFAVLGCVQLAVTPAPPPLTRAVSNALDRLPEGTVIQVDPHVSGWVLWAHPTLRPVKDLRAEVYSPSVTAAYLAFERGADTWPGYVMDHAITAALLPDDSPLAKALAATDTWQKSASGDGRSVWVR